MDTNSLYETLLVFISASLLVLVAKCFFEWAWLRNETDEKQKIQAGYRKVSTSLFLEWIIDVD